MKKLPNGISNYEELIEDGYLYVDKTPYIEKLENLTDKRIMFLRPRKFGKTLFTSMLENYYDIKKADKFEKLYSETYIGKHPTELKNSYHILKFNFSGIDTGDEETTMQGFQEKVKISIDSFAKKYNIDFYINEQQTIESILKSLFEAFRFQKENEKIYVIIDEYDHFANELLSFNTSKFKELLSKNGKVRKWYEILKEGTESVVDRIFITGVAPITLDSLTSGFNISKDITRNANFNEMLGFTNIELKQLMKEQQISEENQEILLPVMKENYDGYQFSIDGKEKIYNSNMCLYFLNSYLEFNKIPRELIDVNIASDFSKLGKMLDLCQGENRIDIIEKTIEGIPVLSEITEKFNVEIGFGEKELISMLFYLGYLTIIGEEVGYPKLKIPNKIMRELYSDYFLEVLGRNVDIRIDNQYTEIAAEMATEGKIDKIIELEQRYLTNLSNRDFQRFDEKYIKLIFYCIAMNLKIYNVKSEMEIERKYPDITLIPVDSSKGYNSIMVEFKYLKKGEENQLKEKQEEARKQIEEYGDTEEMKNIEKINKYTIVVVVDKMYVEKI